MRETIYKDEGLNLDGAFVTLERRASDGYLIVEIDTSDCSEKDYIPSLEVPRLLVCINRLMFKVHHTGFMKPVAE